MTRADDRIAPLPLAKRLRARPALHEVQFCRTSDDVRIAYACVGDGPPLVWAAHWLSHLAFSWESPYGVTGPKSSRRTIPSFTTTSVATVFRIGITPSSPSMRSFATSRRCRRTRSRSVRTHWELERWPDVNCLCGASPGAGISPRPLRHFRAGLAEEGKCRRNRAARGDDHPDAAGLGAGQPRLSADPDIAVATDATLEEMGWFNDRSESRPRPRMQPGCSGRLEKSMSSTFCRASSRRRSCCIAAMTSRYHSSKAG